MKRYIPTILILLGITAYAISSAFAADFLKDQSWIGQKQATITAPSI
jgi:hypothetical protein